MESLIEEGAMLDSAGEARFQYVMQLVPPAHACELERLQREQSPIGAYRQACLAQ